MTEPQLVEVELSDLLRDLQPRALKGLVSVPIGYRADRLIESATAALPLLGAVSHGDLVSALLHAAVPDGAAVAQLIGDYRNARVWQTRQSLGDRTPESGSWPVPVRTRGQRVSR